MAGRSKRARNLAKMVNCVYCGDDRSLDEVIALTEESVQLCGMRADDELQFALRRFVIHTKHGLCSLEDGHIERGGEVFVCGLLVSVVGETTDRDSGVPVKMIGPLNEWWFSGFDGGKDLLLGVDSPYASYRLVAAHSSYEVHFEPLCRKMYLTKCVIECITENPYCNLEELLLAMGQRFDHFDHELFLGSVQFIVRQIDNYDAYGDSDEVRLAETAAFKALLKLAGASVIASADKDTAKGKCLPRKRKFIQRLNTPITETIFSSMFGDVLLNSGGGSSKRSNVLTAAEPAEFTPGDFIRFEFNATTHCGRVISHIGDGNASQIHVNLFCSGTETLLGETSPQQFLFATKECLSLNCSHLPSSRLKVRTMPPLDLKLLNSESPEDDHLVCFQLFDPESCSFEELPAEYVTSKEPLCFGCRAKEMNTPKLISIEGNRCELQLSNLTIREGDCIAFEAKLADLPVHDYFTCEEEANLEPPDQALYPERYRKAFSRDALRDCYSLADLSRAPHIGLVNRISKREGTIQLEVNLFYRPQNVFRDYGEFLRCNLGQLFWTDALVTVEATQIRQKCQVVYSPSASASISLPLSTFHFDRCYNTSTAQFYEPPDDLKLKFSTKTEQTFPSMQARPLCILDLFSGCGGLSHGFKKFATELYAVESDQYAAKSFEANYKHATVFNGDVNVILDQLANSQDDFIKGRLPRKHSVDIIIGGPPCQGFSEMNRFSSSEYSRFKSSLVASFLNYVEYFRPRCVLLENVRNLALYRNSLLLKMICSFFIRLGYQLRVAILQAGCYGLPQNRRRLFIIGAALGVPLPEIPSPTHMFAGKHCDTSFKVDGTKYDPLRGKLGLLRMITIEDAIADLAVLTEQNYFCDTARTYELNGNLLLHYQRLMRVETSLTVRDHCCRQLSKLNRERIRRIPLCPGSDWRDLPNIEVRLEDGTILPKLQYKYADTRFGAARGVCSCASQGEVCQADKCRQEKTLIPWCLVHTANRRNHWPGLFGRLAWRGFFPTIVTNPDPISVQGRVIHPQQSRVLSVREVARSQGFPDEFTFCGPIEHRYRQIGNAVPPPLSAAIAQQFVQSLCN